MNKMEFVDALANQLSLSKVKAGEVLDGVIDEITKAMKKGDELRLVGFGTFSIRKRAAGKGRVPGTDKEIRFPASKNVKFKAGAQLKAAVNKSR